MRINLKKKENLSFSGQPISLKHKVQHASAQGGYGGLVCLYRSLLSALGVGVCISLSRHLKILASACQVNCQTQKKWGTIDFLQFPRKLQWKFAKSAGFLASNLYPLSWNWNTPASALRFFLTLLHHSLGKWPRQSYMCPGPTYASQPISLGHNWTWFQCW